jgi:hypothetical protein
MTGKSFIMFNFPASRRFKALGRSAIAFHFWHVAYSPLKKYKT